MPAKEDTAKIDYVASLIAAKDTASVSIAYDFAVRQVAAEEAQMGRVETKAASLFSVIGFCVTFAISFGGWALLDHVEKTQFGTYIAILFAVVLTAGFTAGAFALKTLKVRRDLRTIDDGEIFNPKVLAQSTDEYRIFVTAHAWQVARENRKINDEKGGTLGWGQLAFLLFIGGMVVLSILLVVSALRTPLAASVAPSAAVVAAPSAPP